MIIPQSEAEFQAVVVKYAEDHGWHWMHIHTTGTGRNQPARGTLGRGWPDLVLVRGDQLIFAELKRQDAGPTPQHQLDVLNVLSAVATSTYIWRPSQLALIMDVLA
jgi:inosine/xanthosine triphosphate pyrophosphatase family protein